MKKGLTVYQEHYLNIIKALEFESISDIKKTLFESIDPIKDKEFIDIQSEIIDSIKHLR